MKRMLALLSALLIAISSISIIASAVANTKDVFIADFKSTSQQWEGSLIDNLGYETDYFGTNAGWSNNAGSITTKQTYDFGDKFDVNFKLYTNYANGDKNNTNEDFYITVGKFKIAICDFQTRVELYYDNQKLDGEFVCSNANYVAEKEYKYDVHIEKGLITITSDIVTYTSNFSDFEAVNNANVGIGINETWQIWKEHFSELTVGNFPKEEEVEREKTFIADFNADSPQWKGELVEYLGYNTNCFGTNAGWSNNAGSITTKQTYDFGDKFDVNFKLYTNYANGDKNNTNEDFYITVGKFKIAICDFQTRVELYYDNQKLDGEFVCSDSKYLAEKEYEYKVHIEKGSISIRSDILTYTTDFADFEAVNDAAVGITINENWQIWSEYFSVLKVGDIEDFSSDESQENVKPKNEFTADFSSDKDWTGLVEYLKYGSEKNFFGTRLGWNNKKGELKSKSIFDFGNNIDLRFSLYTSDHNGDNNGSDEEFYINVGKFKLAICDFQTRLEVYYDNSKLTGETVYKAKKDYPESGVRDYNYIVSITKDGIVIESELLKYKSDFTEYETVDKAEVSIVINETWQIYNEYFGYLTINVPEKVYLNGGNIFATRFEDVDLWEGKLSKVVNTEKGRFPSDFGWNNLTGKIQTSKKYDFSDEFTIFFGLNTLSYNATYKSEYEKNKNHTDYKITVGDISFESKCFQNGLSISKNGVEVKSIYNENADFNEKRYEYKIVVNKGNITVVQYNGDDELLSLNCTVENINAANNTFVILEVLETWQISTGYFDYVIVADNSLGIKSADSYFNSLDGLKYDWTDSAYGGKEFESDFSDASLWTDELTEYIKEDGKRFSPKSAWDNKKGKITTAKWYDFDEAVKVRFSLFTSYPNDALKNSKLDTKYKEANYSVNIGKFKIDIRYFQNGLAVYYDSELIGEIQNDSLTYNDKDYSYLFLASKDGIVVKQMNGSDVVLQFESKFNEFEEFSKTRISIEVLEDWQIWNGYFKSISAVPYLNYKAIYSFNAFEDVTQVLSSETPERAWVKTQWAVKQRINDTDWNVDTVAAKPNITGFYSSIPADPSAIPVLLASYGDYSSAVGVYNGKLLLMANFPDSKKRTTTLSFECPADGKIRLHDPDLGLISVPTKLNGVSTWCLNSSDTEVKSMHIAIYQNDKKIWPLDGDEFLLSNESHPEATSAVRDTYFPDLLIDVKQGDMIHFAVRPEHYILSSKRILSNNPSALLMNPQVDYIKVSGEMKYNTDREPVVIKPDVNIADKITNKTAIIRFPTAENSDLMPIIIWSSVSMLAAIIIVVSLVILLKVKKRRV